MYIVVYINAILNVIIILAHLLIVLCDRLTQLYYHIVFTRKMPTKNCINFLSFTLKTSIHNIGTNINKY